VACSSSGYLPFLVPSVKAIDQSQKEKSLLRLYIIHHVLAKLGYADARILECLQSLGSRLVAGGIDDKINSGWEDALDWVSPNGAACYRFTS
jgi:hypothetical protein